MKVKLVQDSIIFISDLTQEQLAEANKFIPGSTTLVLKDEETKKVRPICMIAYAEEGSVSRTGIVFDSTTEDGKMCKTLVGTQGYDPHFTAEEKQRLIAEEYAGLILNINELEEQIVTALRDNNDKIEAAKRSISTVSITED